MEECQECVVDQFNNSVVEKCGDLFGIQMKRTVC